MGKEHRKEQFTDMQNVRVRRQTEGGEKVGEICRKCEISEYPSNSWKRKNASLGLNEPRELREL